MTQPDLAVPAAPAPDVTPEPTPPQPDPLAEARADAEKWKKLSRENEKTAKANADAAKRLGEIEAANATDLEKAVKAARDETAATIRSEVTRDRVLDKVEALAGRDFADPEDAKLRLGARADEFVKDGAVDADAIRTALTQLLKDRPHLSAKPDGKVRGDVGQGVRPDSAKPKTLQDAIASRLSKTP